jgi:RNA polymerase sigma-70 factor (ECF subfamily)
MASQDDLSLLRRVAARDRVAFEALYRAYHPRLFSYLLRVTRSAEVVEELLSEIMLAVWTGAPRFAGRSRPSTWIFGIAHHKAQKAMARRRPELLQESAAHDAPDAGQGPQSMVERRELRSLLGRALRSLSTEQREVVELTYFHDFSYREIAEIVGCPVNTVKTRMFHARRRLRELLPALGVPSAMG